MPDPGIEGERFVVEEDGLVQGLQSTGAVEAWIWDRPDEVVLLLLALAEVDHDLEVQALAVRVLQTSCSGAMALSYQVRHVVSVEAHGGQEILARQYRV